MLDINNSKDHMCHPAATCLKRLDILHALTHLTHCDLPCKQQLFLTPSCHCCFSGKTRLELI